MSCVTRITITRTLKRKQPKEGDERFLKGRQVWQIRQQVMHTLPGSCGRMARVVSSGRPAWEWVDKGSDRDRKSDAWKAKRAAELAVYQ